MTITEIYKTNCTPDKIIKDNFDIVASVKNHRFYFAMNAKFWKGKITQEEVHLYNDEVYDNEIQG